MHIEYNCFLLLPCTSEGLENLICMYRNRDFGNLIHICLTSDSVSLGFFLLFFFFLFLVHVVQADDKANYYLVISIF